MPGAEPDGASSLGADALTCALACVVVELAVQIVLLASATMFPTQRDGWLAMVGVAALTGVLLAVIERVRARHGPARAHALALVAAALALSFVASVYAGALLRFAGPASPALGWLPRTDWWPSTGLALELRVATIGGLLHARARGAGPSGQRFDMALAGLVALLALAPSLPASWWSGGDDMSALVLFGLLHAALLPTCLATASRVRIAVSKPRGAAPTVRPPLRESALAALAALRAPESVDTVARRIERGLARAPALVDLSWRLLALSSGVAALLLMIGAERARTEFGQWFPSSTRSLGPSAIHGALLGIGALGLLGWGALRREESPAIDPGAARRRLLQAFVALLLVSLGVWSTHPRWPDSVRWSLLWVTVVVGIVSAGVLPLRLGLAITGAYLAHASAGAPVDLLLRQLQESHVLVGGALLLLALGLDGRVALGRGLLLATIVVNLAVPPAMLLCLENEAWWSFQAALALALLLALAVGPLASWVVRRGWRPAVLALVVSAALPALTVAYSRQAGPLMWHPAAGWAHWQADRGDAEAMLDLARRYDVGMGAAESEVLADAWYARAADAGLPAAMHAWGQRLVAGRDTRLDVAAGEAWLARAAAAGHGMTREP